MRYIYENQNLENYATNLRFDRIRNHINWDSPAGRSTVVIQCPFGERPHEKMDLICSAMNDKVISFDHFIEVLPDIYIRIVNANDKGRMSGCPVQCAPSTYEVFACDINEQNCVIYKPHMQAMALPFCDIPTEVSVKISMQTKMVGVFSKREVPTGFYTIEFIGDSFGGYIDGDLQYRIGELTIPITIGMVRQKRVYIKSNTKPNVLAARKGIKLQ